MQAHGVRLAREPVDPVPVRHGVEDDRVELVGIAELLDLVGDVHELAVLEQGLRVGEGNGEDVGEASARELHGERRPLPLVFDTDDVDVGVLLLELLLLLGEGRVRGLVRAGRERGDAEFGLAVGVAATRAAGGECAYHRNRGEAGDRDRSW